MTWTGNRGTGTSGYRDYDRALDVAAEGRVTSAGSADPAFRGDPAGGTRAVAGRVAVLHLGADAGVGVTGYVDRGTMTEAGDGGRFTEVVLRPQVTVASPTMVDAAMRLHDAAHRECFIANSVNFPVRHEPTIQVTDADALIPRQVTGTTATSR